MPPLVARGGALRRRLVGGGIASDAGVEGQGGCGALEDLSISEGRKYSTCPHRGAQAPPLHQTGTVGQH